MTPPADGTGDDGSEGARKDRLRQHFLEADGERASALAHARPGGEGENDAVASAHVLAQQAGDRPAVELRHDDVEQHHRGAQHLRLT